MPTVLMCHKYTLKQFTALYQSSNVGIGNVGMKQYNLVVYSRNV